MLETILKHELVRWRNHNHRGRTMAPLGVGCTTRDSSLSRKATSESGSSQQIPLIRRALTSPSSTILTSLYRENCLMTMEIESLSKVRLCSRHETRPRILASAVLVTAPLPDTLGVFASRLQLLLSLGWPVWCTEYRARGAGSTFEGSLPIGKRHTVAMLNWGLVDGMGGFAHANNGSCAWAASIRAHAISK